MRLIKRKLTSDQEKKVKADLQLINKLSKVARNIGMRVIIGGGYAVDGFLSQITRPHNDIDIQIYGTESTAEKAVEKLLDSIGPSEFEYTMKKDKGRSEYYHNLIYKFGPSILDVYYLQVTTRPLGKEKFIVKSSGEVDEQEFLEPTYGSFEGINFEIQSPQVEIEDKVYKREVRGDVKRLEHEQDIENLKHKLNMKGKTGI